MFEEKKIQVTQWVDASAKQKKSPFPSAGREVSCTVKRQQASGHIAKVLGIFIT